MSYIKAKLQSDLGLSFTHFVFSKTGKSVITSKFKPIGFDCIHSKTLKMMEKRLIFSKLCLNYTLVHLIMTSFIELLCKNWKPIPKYYCGQKNFQKILTSRFLNFILLSYLSYKHFPPCDPVMLFCLGSLRFTT